MKDKNPPVWRQFEKLVARIERLAAPHGAVVKSPDRIRDLTTGKLREVDASIRHKIGTADILITVECRRRGQKGGDTWIEQLATKKQKIGAAKTIAVSSCGFTSSAAVSAPRYGIELRTLSELSAADINGWFLPGGAVHLFRSMEDIRCFIVLYEESGAPADKGFFAPDCFHRVLHSEMIQSPFPIAALLSFLELTEVEKFDTVPFDGTKVCLTFPVQWNVGSLLLSTTQGKKSIYRTRLEATVSYKSAVCDLADGRHYEYNSPQGGSVQHTSFESEMFDLPVRFDHQVDESGVYTVGFEFGAELKPKD